MIGQLPSAAAALVELALPFPFDTPAQMSGLMGSARRGGKNTQAFLSAALSN